MKSRAYLRTGSLFVAIGLLLAASYHLHEHDAAQAAAAAQEELLRRTAAPVVQVPAVLATGLSVDTPTIDDASLERRDVAVADRTANAVTTTRPALGEPVGQIEFLGHRYAVVEGTGDEQLRAGPGRYVSSALPGGPGNFAVAGHRTTFGAPFRHIDELDRGEHITVWDRSGQRFTYRVIETQVVRPGDVWVIGPDPLGTGVPMLTLTTCHPVGSARERLIVFAQRAD